MAAATVLSPWLLPPIPVDCESRVEMGGVTWDQYEAVRRALEDQAGVRIAYFRGTLEIMVPGHEHETAKKIIARLTEIFALEKNIPLNGYGSETFKDRAKEVGLEPDECYSIGPFTGLPQIA